MEPCNLTAQFRPDRTSRAGDHDGPALEQLRDVRRVDGHLFAAQQVLQVDLPHARHERLALGQRRQRRQHQRTDVGAYAQARHAPMNRSGGRRHRDDHVLDLVALRHFLQIADAAEHLVAMDLPPELALVVIEQADQPPLRRSAQLPGQAGAGLPGPQQQHRLSLADQATVTVELLGGAIRGPASAHDEEQHHRHQQQH